MTHRFLARARDGPGEGARRDRGRRLPHHGVRRTKRGADRLVSQLKREGVDADAIHGDLRQRACERALKNFQAGSHVVLVATDVAAPRIDVDDVDVVVHFDPPEEHKGYVHRSGRTARAGWKAIVVTLVLWDQELAVEQLQRRLGSAAADHRGVLERPAPRRPHNARLPAPRRRIATAS